MTAFLLEQPMRLSLLVIVSCAGAFVAWRITSDKLYQRVAMITAIVGAVLVVANIAIDTEREQLDHFLHTLFRDIAKKGLPGAVDSIAPSYNHNGITFAEIKKALRGRHGQWQFARVERQKWRYEKRQKGLASLEFTCRPFLLLGGLPRPMEPSTWSVEVKRVGNKWLMTKIRPVEIKLPMGAGSADSLKRLLRRR